jgi:tetratricopeptide (TPR) repeat protein
VRTPFLIACLLFGAVPAAGAVAASAPQEQALTADAHRARAEALGADYAAAAPEWRRAIELYQAAGDTNAAAWAAVVFASTVFRFTPREASLMEGDRAVALAEAAGDPEVLAQALAVRGEMRSRMGDPVAGEADLRRSLPLTPTRSAFTLSALAQALHHQGRYDEAAELYDEAILAWEALGPTQRAGLSDALMDFAYTRVMQNLLSESEVLYRRSIAVAEGAGDDKARDYGRAMLGWSLHLQRRHDEAEPLLREAVAKVEAIDGTESFNYAAVVINLAAELQAQDRHAEALDLYRRGLAIIERVYGPDHPEVAWCLNAMAPSVAAVEGPGAATDYFRRGLEMAQRQLPPGHPDESMRAEGYGRHLVAQGRAAEALAVLRPAAAHALARAGGLGDAGGKSEFDRTRSLFRVQVEAAWDAAQGS